MAEKLEQDNGSIQLSEQDNGSIQLSELDSQISSMHTNDFQHSAWVDEAREKLKHFVDFQALVKNFFKLQECLYIANNDAVVAGENFGDVQIGIHHLSSETAKLCSESIILLGEFESTCKDVISDFRNGYLHLLDGQNELAAIAFKQLSIKSFEMEKESLKLAERFNNLSFELEKVLQNIITLKSIYDLAKREVDDKLKDITIRRNHLNEKLKEAILAEQNAAKNKQLIENEPNQGIFENIISNIQQMSCSFVSLSASIAFNDKMSAPVTSVLSRNGAAVKKYEEAKQATAKVTDLSMSLDCESFELEQAKCKAEQATRTLHDAAGWLKELSTFMFKTATFWKQLNNHCRRVYICSNQEIEMIDVVMTKHSAERSQILRSDSFKQAILRNCATWWNLQLVCADSKKELQKTEEVIYVNIQQNPTPEQATANVLRAVNNYESYYHLY